MSDNLTAESATSGIRRAALEMAYDNGAINRERSEEHFLIDLSRWLDTSSKSISHSGLRGSYLIALSQIDGWLKAQSDDDILTVCAGEDTEMRALLANAPHGTDMLLNAIFREVL